MGTRGHRRFERELIRMEALQSALFNSANLSSIATDPKGVIQFFNVGAERMLGYQAREVVNQMTLTRSSTSPRLPLAPRRSVRKLARRSGRDSMR